MIIYILYHTGADLSSPLNEKPVKISRASRFAEKMI